MSALFGAPEEAPRKVLLLTFPFTLLFALYCGGGDHSAAQHNRFGLAAFAATRLFTSAAWLPFGSILALSIETPMWPLVLLSAKSAVALAPASPYHALDTPTPRIN